MNESKRCFSAVERKFPDRWKAKQRTLKQEEITTWPERGGHSPEQGQYTLAWKPKPKTPAQVSNLGMAKTKLRKLQRENKSSSQSSLIISGPVSCADWWRISGDAGVKLEKMLEHPCQSIVIFSKWMQIPG